MDMSDSSRDFISYIPPINRGLVQDLDRSLRETLEAFNSGQKNVETIASDASRDIVASVSAVKRAANLIEQMAARIRELEESVEEGTVQQLASVVERNQLSAQYALVSEKLALQTERCNLAEALNKEHEAHSREIAEELAAAHADIERLTGVIAEAFGSLEHEAS